MYLTAQRVLAPCSNAEGTNVFGYSHPVGQPKGIDWRAPDVATIADHEPGRLMFSLRKVEGPGNSVLSYLDVAIADHVPAQTVANLLHAAASAWRLDLPLWTHGPMALRFYCNNNKLNDATAELRKLKDNLVLATAGIVSVSRGDQPFPPRPPQPLRIFRSRGAASYRFELDQPSREFLAQTRPDLNLPAGMNITYETEEAFRSFAVAQLEAVAARALTQLAMDQLNALAGAVVLDADSGNELWRFIDAIE